MPAVSPAYRVSSAASWPVGPPVGHRGPPSLQAECLGVIGDCLEEVVAMGDQVAPYLPTEAKSLLLSVAARWRLLNPEALLLLADSGQPVLSLCVPAGGGGPALSERAICQALQQAPDLRLLDLTGRALGGGALVTLARWCPRLEVLRLGELAACRALKFRSHESFAHAPFLQRHPVAGSPTMDRDGSVVASIKRLLPVPDGRGRPAADSWDDLEPEAALDAALSGRLARLRLLQWPGMPHSLRQHCRAACPQLLVNPSPEEAAAAAGGLPPAVLAACCPAASLDGERLRAGVARCERWDRPRGGGGGAASPPPILHIAERFRLAYVAQERGRRLREEREWRQAQRRQLRQSPAAAAIEAWETSL